MNRLIKGLLHSVAAFSDQPYKVGAIYVQGWRVSYGYNVSAAYGCHAEDITIRRFEILYGRPAIGGTMYCTYSACSHCAKTLKQKDMANVYASKYTGKL